MDYKAMYKSLKEKVDTLSLKEEEKKRIKDEEELFALRGWEEYIALAVDIINRVDEFPIIEDTFGGTVFNSLFVYYARERREHRFCDASFKKFSSSNLLLHFNALGPGIFIINNRLKEISRCVDIPLKASSFLCEEFLLEGIPESAYMGERIIVSKSPLDDVRESFALWNSQKSKECGACLIIDIMCYKAL